MYVRMSMITHQQIHFTPTTYFPSPFEPSADFSQPHSDIFANLLHSYCPLGSSDSMGFKPNAGAHRQLPQGAGPRIEPWPHCLVDG
jgi:hypothetical protein